jgi:hypothetical protein
MAISNVKATQVTKWDSGSEASTSYIENGYIKTVEKVWIDTYTYAATIPSSAQLTIAYIPKNKKVTSIDLIFPEALSTASSGTGTTISLGIKSDTGSFLSAGEACAGVGRLSANRAACAGNTHGLLYITTSESTQIVATFERIATTSLTGTIISIVRYT